MRRTIFGVPTCPWHEIPTPGIEEVVVGLKAGEKHRRSSLDYSAPTLMARGDLERMLFGQGLSGDEAHYTKAVLLRGLHRSRKLE